MPEIGRQIDAEPDLHRPGQIEHGRCLERKPQPASSSIARSLIIARKSRSNCSKGSMVSERALIGL